MELERGGLSEGEDCSAPGEDGGFRAFCLGTSSEPGSLGWGVYVCLCDRCIRFPVKFLKYIHSVIIPRNCMRIFTKYR